MLRKNFLPCNRNCLKNVSYLICTNFDRTELKIN